MTYPTNPFEAFRWTNILRVWLATAAIIGTPWALIVAFH